MFNILIYRYFYIISNFQIIIHIFQAMEHNGEWTEIIDSEYILKGLGNMGFIKPTPIQKAVIPQAIQHRKDIIGAAETGSGKTLAFAIPIFDRWLKELKKDVPKDQTKLFALIVTPTRELAIQIRDVFRQLSAVKEPRELRIVAIVGGMSIQKQQRLLKSQPDIIVGTPGRLWALKESGEEHLNILSGLQFIVVDEIDRMLKEGHFQELKYIIKHIHSKRTEHFKNYWRKRASIADIRIFCNVNIHLQCWFAI
uniref:ATP-dependent RNA helicase n=1 Tax=Meloidogyne enterolobii TaxID=390850 RepID=A0A6V7WRU8_MELEN|nr:unnamed protein product [Meloidogyne enterolobii]